MRKLTLLLLATALLGTAHAGIGRRLPLLGTYVAGFTESTVGGGIVNGVAMAFAPDGRIFVTEQAGKIRVIKNGATLATPFLDIVGATESSGERGALGIAFDPNFAANNFVYLYHTVKTPAVHNRISRYTANGDVALKDGGGAYVETVLLDLENLSATNHNGGALHFGPDGKLYASVGENAIGSNAQTVSNRLGKMLRLNSDGSPAQGATTFKMSNGSTVSTAGANTAIWALGLRNPFTFAFQPGTGRLFVNDVGQNKWEEINDGIMGSNYGWSGGDTDGATANGNFKGPHYLYEHGSGTPNGYCIAGGAFYPTAGPYPSTYYGKYFFADYVNNWIGFIDPAAPPAANGANSSFARSLNGPTDLAVGSDGLLYCLEHNSNGRVLRINFPGGTQQAIQVSTASVSINKGSNANFTARLALDPGAGITITLAAKRTAGATIVDTNPNPKTIAFTSANWNVPQNINVSVANDATGANEQATITCSAPGLTSQTVSVTAVDTSVVNGPTASISKPANGDVVSGANAEFFGNATPVPPAMLDKAEFYVDNVLKYTDDYSGVVGHFHYGGDHGMFDTTGLSNGPHTLRMTVYDSNGLTGSAQVNVTVSNGVGAAPTGGGKSGSGGCGLTGFEAFLILGLLRFAQKRR